MTEVELFDGTILEFPEGTSQEVIDRVAKRETQARRQQSETIIARTPDGGRVVESGGVRSFVSPSYSTTDAKTIDRILEGEGVTRVVQSEFDQDVIERNPVAARANEFVRGVPFVGSYADEAIGMFAPQAQNAMRMTTAAMQRENPGQTAALNMGGAVAGSIPMALAAGPTVMAAAPKSVAGRAVGGGLLGMVGGGTEGAIYGQGEGTGEFLSESRRDEATRQGVLGAALGGGLGAVLPAAGGLVQSLIRRFKGEDVAMIAREFNVSRDTARVLKTAFEQNDATAVDRILRAGSEATLADAGRSGQALLDASAQTGGRALNIVDNAVTARANRANTTITKALDDALGPVTGPRAAAREVAEASRPQRTAAYGAAYGTPIDYTTGNAAGERVLEVIDALPPRIRAQVAQRMEELSAVARLRGEPFPDAPLFNANGERIGDMPTVMQLDLAKRALDSLSEAGKDAFGRSTPEGVTYGQLAAAVRDATQDATGGATGTYARALSIGRDKIELDNGLRLGLEMLRNTNQTTREMVGELLQGMSEDGRAMVRRGLRSYLDETMARVKSIASDTDAEEARQAYAQLRELSSGAAREKMRILLGPEEFDRLQPQLDEAMASLAMRASVAQNSKTAVRTAIQGTVDDITQPGIAGRAARGQPIDATQALVQELMATTPADDAARREGIWAEVARVLSEQRGNKSAQAALKFIEDAIGGTELSEAQVRLIANQFLIGTGVAGTRTGSQARSISESAR